MVIGNQAGCTTGTFTLVSIAGRSPQWEDPLRHMACNELSSSELEPPASTAIWPFVFFLQHFDWFPPFNRTMKAARGFRYHLYQMLPSFQQSGRKQGDDQGKGAHQLWKSWGLKTHILLEERLTDMQSKLAKTAVVAFGDLSADLIHAATSSLIFLSYTKTGIIIFNKCLSSVIITECSLEAHQHKGIWIV